MSDETRTTKENSGGYRPATLLVTGGCGYLGSQLIRDLVHGPCFAGATVRILDNMQREGYPALMNLPPEGRYQFLEGDILDPAAVRRALHGVEAVVHLAALVKTPFSFDHPTWTEQVNYWGTARLVEHCLEAGVTRFIFASTAGVYGPGTGTPFDEQAACHPVSPYAHAKLRAEGAVLAAVPRGLQPTVLRLATAFGRTPMTRFDAVANRFAYLTGVGRPLTIYGNGEQVRPLIHVRDAGRAVRFCLAHPDETLGNIFNVVGENVSILNLVEAVQLVNPGVRVHYTEQDVLNQFSFAVDGRRLEELGWYPRYSIEQGLAELIGRFENLAALPQATPGDVEF
jgi:nucleoside-diphosphate-sugar epimerase